MKSLLPIRRYARSGLTLIELLIVITILAIVSSFLVPQLRIVNQDRNIREAGRAVGSVFSRVSQRSVNQGSAGLVFVRNPNFIDDDGCLFAATSIFEMKPIPPYAGDTTTSFATPVTGQSYQVHIDIPIDGINTIAVGDYISFNNTAVRYRILEIGDVTNPLPSAGMTGLRLSPGEGASLAAPVLPQVPQSGSYPFIIYRSPRIDLNSEITLPDGFYVDLRFSGPVSGDVSNYLYFPAAPFPSVARSRFHEVLHPMITESGGPAGAPSFADATQVKVYFNQAGEIDRYTYYDPRPLRDPMTGMIIAYEFGRVRSVVPLESMYFFVCGFNPENTSRFGELDSDNALWVKVDKSTGGTTVLSNTTNNGANYFNKITNGRTIAKSGQSASQ